MPHKSRFLPVNSVICISKRILLLQLSHAQKGVNSSSLLYRRTSRLFRLLNLFRDYAPADARNVDDLQHGIKQTLVDERYQEDG